MVAICFAGPPIPATDTWVHTPKESRSASRALSALPAACPDFVPTIASMGLHHRFTAGIARIEREFQGSKGADSSRRVVKLHQSNSGSDGRRCTLAGCAIGMLGRGEFSPERFAIPRPIARIV